MREGGRRASLSRCLKIHSATRYPAFNLDKSPGLLTCQVNRHRVKRSNRMPASFCRSPPFRLPWQLGRGFSTCEGSRQKGSAAPRSQLPSVRGRSPGRQLCSFRPCCGPSSAVQLQHRTISAPPRQSGSGRGERLAFDTRDRHGDRCPSFG